MSNKNNKIIVQDLLNKYKNLQIIFEREIKIKKDSEFFHSYKLIILLKELIKEIETFNNYLINND